MKKIIALGLALVCMLSLIGCNVKKESEQDTVVRDEINTDVIDTSNDLETDVDKENQPSVQVNNLPQMTMEIILIDDKRKIQISDNEAVLNIYDALNSLKYEVSEDVSMTQGVAICFYDANDNMIQSFNIYKKHLKLNGLPDTYKITDAEFDYDTFCEQLKKAS